MGSPFFGGYRSESHPLPVKTVSERAFCFMGTAERLVLLLLNGWLNGFQARNLDWFIGRALDSKPRLAIVATLVAPVE